MATYASRIIDAYTNHAIQVLGGVDKTTRIEVDPETGEEVIVEVGNENGFSRIAKDYDIDNIKLATIYTLNSIANRERPIYETLQQLGISSSNGTNSFEKFRYEDVVDMLPPIARQHLAAIDFNSYLEDNNYQLLVRKSDYALIQDLENGTLIPLIAEYARNVDIDENFSVSALYSSACSAKYNMVSVASSTP